MYRSLMLIALYISALAAAAPNPPSNEPDNQPPNQPVVGIRPPNQPVVGLPDNHPLNQPGAGSRPPNQPVVGLPDNHPLNQPGAGSRPPNQPANPLADQQDLSPARLATRNLHNNCQNIRIENPPPPLQNMDTANAQPRYATELTASPESEYWSDASTLRGSERRANLPRAPKPLLVGNCKKRDGQSRETKLSLDYCLGWREENGGTLVAESSGFGMQKGQCRNCNYYIYYTGVLDFKIICSCANASDRRQRVFKTSGVITYDNNSGRIRCHNNPGS